MIRLHTGTSHHKEAFEFHLPPKKPAHTSIVFRSFSEPEPVDRKYLKKISSDLHFEEDVVKDRCYHMLPYDEKYLYEALTEYPLTLAVEL
jgi:hypothetical protein